MMKNGIGMKGVSQKLSSFPRVMMSSSVLVVGAPLTASGEEVVVVGLWIAGEGVSGGLA